MNKLQQIILRMFDILASLTGLLFLLPVLVVVTLILLLDTGSPFFIQSRVGKNKKSFTLIKFRTMKKTTKSIASHLSNSNDITKVGRFLRRTKLDELPQLINVLFGSMSLVGPRPNLFNQEELIYERDSRGVYRVKPGITGLSQLKKIDMSTPALLAKTDQIAIKQMSIKYYLSCILHTVIGKGSGDAIK